MGNIKLNELKPDSNNANKGSERGSEMIETSLHELGAGRSIVVDKNGRVIGGNKTLQAAEHVGIEDGFVVETTGEQLVIVKRLDLDLGNPTGKARQLAYADNRTAQVSMEFDPDVIAADLELGLDLGDYFSPDDFDLMGIETSSGSFENGEGEVSTGELLSLIDITIGEPRNKVENGDVWHLGGHVLLCASVITDWTIWSKHLKDDCLFLPHPGPFVALSKRASEYTLIMVQPNKYIAGHIIDRYEDVNGSGEIARD